MKYIYIIFCYHVYGVYIRAVHSFWSALQSVLVIPQAYTLQCKLSSLAIPYYLLNSLILVAHTAFIAFTSSILSHCLM